MSYSHKLLSIAALLCAGACTELGEQPFESRAPDAGAQLADATLEAPTLSELHDRVFGGCSCHLTSAPAADLDLSRDVLYKQLIDRVSTCDGTTALVVPGSPEDSLLVDKLAARTEGGEPACGSGMPLVGAAVSRQDLDAIRAWIADGAPDSR